MKNEPHSYYTATITTTVCDVALMDRLGLDWAEGRVARPERRWGCRRGTPI